MLLGLILARSTLSRCGPRRYARPSVSLEKGSARLALAREVGVDALAASVFVLGQSADAEVLAAALHDNCRAKVVGAKTYGKGIIQGEGLFWRVAAAVRARSARP